MTMANPANDHAADLLVRKNVFVAASPERTFDAFTRDLGKWWPLATHHIGKSDPVDAVFEPHPGGRCYEKGKDGSETQWGTVRVFDRPKRFVFAWQISCDWTCDPAIDTEVEVTFTPEKNGTRVELVHRNLRAYGERAAEMQKIFDSPGGWTGILEGFAKHASAA